MKISVITPSLNQGDYLEKTILSVVNQEGPVQYIVIDGGSADRSTEIMERYRSGISYSVSEPDSGQANAINKGFERADGEVIGWLNSDDYYLIGTLSRVREIFKDPRIMWITGDCEVIDENDTVNGCYHPDLPRDYFQWINLLVRGYSCSIPQPSTFWRKDVLTDTGKLNERLHYSFDHEFFLRIYKQYGPPFILKETLSRFRIHAGSKTAEKNSRFISENYRIGLHFSKEENWSTRLYLYGVYARQRLFHG